MAEVFKVNIKGNISNLSSDSKFVDIPENDSVLFRPAPPVRDDGMLFYPVVNHYKLKDAEGRGTALADLEAHGNDETGYVDYIARLSKALLESGGDDLKKIGKDLKASRRFYWQGWKAVKGADGTFQYERCRLMAVPKTCATDIMQAFKSMDEFGEAPGCDPVGGQLVRISRSGSGFNTKYRAERSGLVTSLDDIIPDWKTQLFEDIYDALKLNIVSPDEQKKLAQLTYPNLPWKELEEKHGL